MLKRLVLALVLLSPASAFAADYVCSLRHLPQGFANPVLGSYGALEVALRSGPNCSGPQTGVKYICTSASTDPACAKGVTRSENGLLQIAGILQRAMESGSPVGSAAAYCNDNSAGCWADVGVTSP